MKLIPEGLKANHNVRDLMYNLVIASDGATSDIWAAQFDRHKTSRLKPSPHNDIRVIGWAPVSSLQAVVGQSISGKTINTIDDAVRRVGSRIWTRRDPGVRFTACLMDYAPLHLSDCMFYFLDTTHAMIWDLFSIYFISDIIPFLTAISWCYIPL